MKITIFGATGGTGRQLVDQACAAGHDVTAVVRDPTMLTIHSNLAVVTSDITDPDALAPAIAGREAVLTAIGPNGRGPTTVHTDTTTTIIEAMRLMDVRRLICVSASGMHTAGDGPLTRALVKPILQRVLRHGFADMLGMEEVVRASGLDWTILRPPRLTNGRRTGDYRTEVDRNVRGSFQVSRADLADCMLRCLTDPTSMGRAISITG
jgi:putative NADH-flavin reductase